MKKYGILLACCFLLVEIVNANTIPQQERRKEQRWVDSVMNTLSLRQRIAQLFIISVETLPNKQKNIDRAVQLIQSEQIGGLIVMKAQPQYYTENINRMQKASTIPLLVTMDAEWGVAMRMDSVIPFPQQMMLGAISDNKLIEKMGEAIAEQCKRIGVQLNYAPVVDVNNNPDNPVINVRSFGENKYNVAEKSIAYMHGLQNKGVLACVKHFPGHGDTSQDSHETLPYIEHSPTRIDSVELYPFKALMETGIDAVMVAHLQVSAYDSIKRPSTLSRSVVSHLLKEELEFSGLVITDALNMKSVTSLVKKDSLSLSALMAGNDVMLMPDNISSSITLIEKAVKEGSISVHKINTKCRKMLTAKYRAGLSNYQPIDGRNLLQDLNSPQTETLRYQLTEKALTLLQNKDTLLPLRRLDTLKIAYLEIGKDQGTNFYNQLCDYTAVDKFAIDLPVSATTLVQLQQALAAYNLVIAGYHAADTKPQHNFGVDSAMACFITELALNKKVILDFFGTPYGIKKFNGYNRLSGLLVSYDNSSYTQERSAQLLFGGVVAQGTLPVSIDSTLGFGKGIRQNEIIRLRYVLPEEIGIDRHQLTIVDTLVMQAIRQHATPGAQVMVVYKGNVFYQKVFGKHTYETNAHPVSTNDVYDWASITKISATLPVIMQLTDKKRINLNKTLGDYIPAIKNTNKGALKIANVLAHSSGLPAFQPFHQTFFPDSIKKAIATLDTVYFAFRFSEQYPRQVAGNLYASDSVAEYIRRQMNTAALLNKTYRYSDWGFMYLQDVAENISGKTLDKLADSLFFAPLGMNNTGFLPLQRISKERIPPTEIDSIFRKQRVQGTVHDPTAALLGGVSGHAGVFGNANDLAKLLQLYLNGGTYGGQRYFSNGTVNMFTRCYACNKGNRRGLGFDKPEPGKEKDSPVGRNWSLNSYGHSGYTGNLCWVEPDRELIVIFLSNRTFPNDDKKLIRLNTRGEVFSKFLNIIDNLR